MFSYERREMAIEAYGQSIPLKPKTPAVADSLQKVPPALNKADYLPMWKSVGVMIGEDKRDELFPSYEQTDLDELMAFWLALCEAYGEQSGALAYTNRAQRRAAEK